MEITNNIKLDNLSIEIYQFYIFKYLDLNDILRLRLTSKKFYAVVGSYIISELTFLKKFSSELNCKFNWFSLTKSSHLKNQLDCYNLGLLINPTRGLLNLKYLKIEVFIEMEHINKFTYLQVLDITYKYSLHNDFLYLPELKALVINHYNEYIGFLSKDSGILMIDTPNLHSLKLLNASYNLLNTNIKIKHPLSIRYLHINKYEEDMDIFNNLECLEFSGNYSKFIDRDGLLKFQKLKQLKVSGITTSQTRSNLRELFNFKIDNLDLIANGVKIKKIEKIKELKNEVIRFQLQNFDDLTDDLNFITEINYNKFTCLLPNYDPSILFEKYTNIQLIKIFSKIEDENRLIQFLAKCDSLYFLIVQDSSLSQYFYDQLPETACSLSRLHISEKIFQLNFAFIMKLHYLIILYSNQDIFINLNSNLNNLKYLERLNFRVGNFRIGLLKKIKDIYFLEGSSYSSLPCKRIDTEYYSLNGLMKLFNILRSDLKDLNI